MKKLLTLFIVSLLLVAPVFSAQDKISEEYLKSKKHFAIMNPVAELIAQSIIKKSIKKEAKGKFRVKFVGYTLSSMKAGVFKYLEITGKDVVVEGIDIPYLRIKTVSDYNRVDLTKKEPSFITNTTLSYEFNLTEDSINQALKKDEYKEIIKRVNNFAYPLFVVNNVRAKIVNNKINLKMDYVLPLAMSGKKHTISMTSDFYVVNGKIYAKNADYDKSAGHFALNKITSLINLLNPLGFTLDILEDNKCDAKIENIRIVDNVAKINGKIFIQGD